MINFDSLDKTKTYIGLEYGKGKISDIIRKYSKEYCYGMNVPSHVFALVYDDSMHQWVIFESHMKGSSFACLPSGTRICYRSLFEKTFPQTIINSDAYQIDLDKKKLFENLSQPYGIGDIFSLMKASLRHNNGKQKDRLGLICSEYIALAFKPIQDYYRLPAWCITPAHFKRYLLDNELEPIS